nr:gamma-aminobutyric acid type B receptor subunit 2-like [Leptinotarsa decemlineata]
MFCTTATLWLVFVPKMLELRRNPGGPVDKRFRPTLRPMSKTRRDSSVSELETKLKDVKGLNSKYRKTLLDKESELQMLVRRLGNEAKEILDSRADSLSETNRLSVPLIRKEPHSATETSDITSLCSLSSQDYTSLQHTDSQK